MDTTRPATTGDATLLPNFPRGAALLRGPDGRCLRLSWDEPGSERERVLPAGRYELLGYRLVAAAGETTWHVSASGLRNVTIGLSPGGTHVLAIEPLVRIEERVKPDGLEVAVTGHERAGLSIYKDGKRIPLGYRRLDRTGARLAEGKLEYG